MKKFFRKAYSRFMDRFFDESLELKAKLSNLIMLCTVAGCFLAFILAIFINQDIYASITIFAAFAVVSTCLYLAAWRKKDKLASLLVVLLINEVVFPIMFVVCGGIRSGMVCWLMVGLIFPFLVLEGSKSVIIFLVSFLTLGSMYVLEYKNLLPFKVATLSHFGWVEDTIQSLALVAGVFGVIFKFQAVVYTKQADVLKKQEAELKESMLKLEQASKAKSDFLANMSHEIRTPINAIMGMNEIVLRDCKDQEVIQNSLNIQSAANNLLSIVNDILDFSKIEAGRLEIIPADYMLSSLLVDCYNTVSMRAFNKGLSFRITNDKDIPENLHGDEFRIRQVVTNLLTNAVKYTKEGFVELNVKYERLDEESILLKFAVIDSGVGISEENRKLLFNSFQRIDEKNNRSIEGTGLGLTISSRLTNQMGGQITVESEEGKGSVFTACIPQKVIGRDIIGDFAGRYNEYQNPKKTDENEVFTAPGKRILVVDDVKMNLNVIKGLLKKSQMEIATALSGREMLELSKGTKYDIIFLDHMMPEMDGIEAFHELKKLNNINVDTPVIVLTANAILGAEEQYIAEGFNDYLSKPVHGKDLEAMIKKYL